MEWVRNVVIWGLLLAGGSARAACPAHPLDAVQQAAEDIEQAYAELDEARFDLSASALGDLIPCIRVQLGADDVWNLHQTQALVAFVNGQSGASRKSLAGAISVKPDWQLDDDQFPQGHPYRELYDEAKAIADGEADRSLRPSVWLVDGVRSKVAPNDRAFVLQAVGSRGEIRYTGYMLSLLDSQEAFIEPEGVQAIDLQVSISGLVTRMGARQEAIGVSSPWVDEQDGAWTGGGQLGIRWLPDPHYGLELRAAGLGGTDPVQGGGASSEGFVRAMFGVAPQVGQAVVRIAARPGFAMDQMRVWGLEDPEAEVFWIPSASIGGEVSVLSEPIIATVGIDGLLASGYRPYQLRPEAQVGWMVAEGFALEAGMAMHLRRIGVETSLAESVGFRSDADVRLALGIGLWR